MFSNKTGNHLINNLMLLGRIGREGCLLADVAAIRKRKSKEEGHH